MGRVKGQAGAGWRGEGVYRLKQQAVRKIINTPCYMSGSGHAMCGAEDTQCSQCLLNRLVP
jgi:hypothetical protein